MAIPIIGNGQKKQRTQVVPNNVSISMNVTCICGRSLMLVYVINGTLSTTCTCKRVIALRGIQIDPVTQQLGTAIHVDDSACLTPTESQLAEHLKVI